MLLAMQALISVLIATGLFLTIYGAFRFPVATEPPVHRRLAAAVGVDRDTVFENQLFAPIMGIGLALASRADVMSLRDWVRRYLNASGNPSGYSVDEYLAICLLSGCGLALGTLLVDLLLGSHAMLVMVPIMLAGGFVAPLITLRSAADRRVARIAKQLPYTLDLVALVMAAGAGFIEAVETLVRDDPEDDLNQELRIVLSEIEFGTTRAKALEHMAERIPLDSLRSVIGAVTQADSLGTPLATILKLQADMLRMHRGVRAEKLSASASLRILVPSMLIMIAVVAIVFAPLAIRFLQGNLL